MVRDGLLQNYYKTYEERYKREHETKIVEDGEEKTSMVLVRLSQFEPMPIRKNKYCGVCKDDYDDYLTVRVRSISTLALPSTKPP
jgi:hypothetical protein